MEGKRNHGTRDGRISAIATAQDGVVSLQQLQTADLSPQAVSQRAGSARLHRIHRGVYAVGHQAIDARGRLLAATLACGSGSAISHLSAAALWGLRDPAPVVIDVIVPCETGRKIDGIRARRCRYPTAAELTHREGIPCTTPSRTLVDLAGILGRSSLRRAVEQAAVLKLFDIAALDAAAAQAKGRRGIPALRSIIASWRPWGRDMPKLRSILEAHVLPALAEQGVRRPQCNVKQKIAGEFIEVDLLWKPERLIVEMDGWETHGTRVAFQSDRRRDQALVAAGYRVARVTWRQAVEESEAVAARIKRMLESADSPSSTT